MEENKEQTEIRNIHNQDVHIEKDNVQVIPDDELTAMLAQMIVYLAGANGYDKYALLEQIDCFISANY